jgi:hypothetical protein
MKPATIVAVAVLASMTAIAIANRVAMGRKLLAS